MKRKSFTETVLESAYFAISDGGLSVSFIEQLEVSGDWTVFPDDWRQGCESGKYIPMGQPNATNLPVEDRYNRSWRFRVEMSNFGAKVTFEFPIFPLNVRWFLDALTRVVDRMEAPQSKPSNGVEFAFRDETSAYISAREGQNLKESFTPGLGYSPR